MFQHCQYLHFATCKNEGFRQFLLSYLTEADCSPEPPGVQRTALPPTTWLTGLFFLQTLFTRANAFFFHPLLSSLTQKLLQRAPAVKMLRLFRFCFHANLADAITLALETERGHAASWHCFSSIFLSGAWHVPHQKDTLLDGLCNTLWEKANQLTMSLSCSQWLTLENELNIFFLPRATKNHKLPALFTVLVGDEGKIYFPFNYYFLVKKEPTNETKTRKNNKPTRAAYTERAGEK